MKKFLLLLICLSLICTATAESIYQVTLLQSLAQGYFDGSMTVADLKEHGDTGIGTFDGLNGEMIVLEGVVYQATGDGSVVVPADDETVPFSNVTFFEEDLELPLSDIPELCQHLQHVYANLLRIVVQTGADDAEAIRCQYPAMQLVSLVLLVLLIFLVRYLLHGNLRSSRTTGICLHDPGYITSPTQRCGRFRSRQPFSFSVRPVLLTP